MRAREIARTRGEASAVKPDLGLDEPKGQALFEMANLRAAQPRAVRVEVWFQDEARIGQKNSLTRVWRQTGSRPASTKGPRLCLGLGVWCGLPIGGQSGGVDHADLQYRRDEPSSPGSGRVRPRGSSSQVAAPAFARAGFAHAVVILDRAGWHRSQGLVVPGNITLLELPPHSPGVAPRLSEPACSLSRKKLPDTMAQAEP